jgi:hypothetical protein
MLNSHEYYYLVEKSALHPFSLSEIENNYLNANPGRWLDVLQEQWALHNQSKEQVTRNWSKIEDDLKGFSRTYRNAVANNYLRELDLINDNLRQYEMLIEQISRQQMVLSTPDNPELAGMYRRAIERHKAALHDLPSPHEEDLQLWKTLEGIWE